VAGEGAHLPQNQQGKIAGKQLFLFHRFHSDLLHKTLHAISHTSPTSPTAAHHRAAVKKPFRRRDAAPSSSPIPIAAEPALAVRRNHLLPFHLCVNPCSSRSADA